MEESPWPIEEDRTGPTNYMLTGRERQFCATGDPGSYSKPRISERIRKKRLNRLPERIQDLIDDIALIQNSERNFLTDQEWNNLLEEIIDLDSRAENVRNEKLLFSHESKSSDATQFGLELGNMVRGLHGKNPRIEVTDLVWGFLIGLVGKGPEHTETEQPVLSSIIGKLEQNLELRESRGENNVLTAGVYGDVTQEIEEEINEALRSQNLTLRAEEVDSEKFYRELTGASHSYNHDPPLSMTVNYWIENKDLRTIDVLRIHLEEDIHTVENRKSRGVEAKDLVREIYEEYSNGDSKPLSAKEMDYTYGYETFITGLLNDLSGRNSELCTERPVVYKDGNGWKLTDYGKCLSYIMFSDRDPTWVYRYCIDNSDLLPKEEGILQKATKR